MTDKPLLTIAIPTYNRPQTLIKIIEQLEKQNNQDFELLICDDCSPDNGATEKLVKGYQQKMANLKFVRNKVNLGFSGNVFNLYELASTRYVWFLCDDDTVLPDAVSSILNALKKYEPVVAIFNFTQLDPYDRPVLTGVTEDKVYEDLSKIKDYQLFMRASFLSILVVEKGPSIDILKSRKYKDNIFFQLTLVIHLLSNKFRICEISSAVLHRNVGFKYGEFFKFYLVDHLKALTILETKFDREKFIKWSKRHLFTAFKLYMSRKIGLFRYEGSPTKETLKYIYDFYGIYSIVVPIFMVAYLLTPAFIPKLYYLVSLIAIHGKSKGFAIYKKNVNRAFSDARETRFTSYR